MVALDSKATIDGNALFRHPELAELTDKSAEDPQEAMAKEKGLTYVKLGGNIGILGNGAGLCMSTLDVVAQAGGKPANFLDAGGGSKAEAIVDALEVITSDANVNAILFNIFGGITRCDEIAKGIIEASRQIEHRVPLVVRLDGTNSEEGLAILAEADLGNLHLEKTMLGAAKAVVELARACMSIIVDEDTKLVVSGLTGREGTFHGLRNRDYGTDLVAGVTPGKGGQDVDGVPVFDSIKEAVDERGANTSMIFVPARFAAAAIEEAIDAGVETVIAITEGIPVLDMMRVYWKAQEAGTRLIGPNCPGVLSPGKANVGIIPAQFFDARADRRRLEVGHADLPDRQRAQAGRDRQLVDRRHRRRPDRRLGLHRHPHAVRERPRDRADRDGRRDRRRRRGARRRLHRRVDLEAGRRLHRRLHRPARQADGPRRGDHLRLLGHRRGEEGGARGEGRPGRQEPDRDRAARGRGRCGADA